MGRITGKTAKYVCAWSVGAVLFLAVVGCGPTRKEYAINEALLIDQTRMLENQLYRAHFQIQRLEGENKRLRARLEAKGEKVEPETAPFEESEALNVPAASAQRRTAAPVRTASVPASRGAAYPKGAQSQRVASQPQRRTVKAQPVSR